MDPRCVLMQGHLIISPSLKRVKSPEKWKLTYFALVDSNDFLKYFTRSSKKSFWNFNSRRWTKTRRRLWMDILRSRTAHLLAWHSEADGSNGRAPERVIPICPETMVKPAFSFLQFNNVIMLYSTKRSHYLVAENEHTQSIWLDKLLTVVKRMKSAYYSSSAASSSASSHALPSSDYESIGYDRPIGQRSFSDSGRAAIQESGDMVESKISLHSPITPYGTVPIVKRLQPSPTQSIQNGYVSYKNLVQEAAEEDAKRERGDIARKGLESQDSPNGSDNFNSTSGIESCIERSPSGMQRNNNLEAPAGLDSTAVQDTDYKICSDGANQRLTPIAMSVAANRCSLTKAKSMPILPGLNFNRPTSEDHEALVTTQSFSCMRSEAKRNVSFSNTMLPSYNQTPALLPRSPISQSPKPQMSQPRLKQPNLLRPPVPQVPQPYLQQHYFVRPPVLQLPQSRNRDTGSHNYSSPTREIVYRSYDVYGNVTELEFSFPNQASYT